MKQNCILLKNIKLFQKVLKSNSPPSCISAKTVSNKYKIVGDRTSPNSTQTRFLNITLYTKSISIHTIIPIFNSISIHTSIPDNHSNTNNHFKDDKNIPLVEHGAAAVAKRRDYSKRTNAAKGTLAKP